MNIQSEKCTVCGTMCVVGAPATLRIKHPDGQTLMFCPRHAQGVMAKAEEFGLELVEEVDNPFKGGN